MAEDKKLWEHQEWENEIPALFGEFTCLSIDDIINLFLDATGVDSKDDASRLVQELRDTDQAAFGELVEAIYDHANKFQEDYNALNRTDYGLNLVAQTDVPWLPEYDDYGSRVDQFYYFEVEILFDSQVEANEIDHVVSTILVDFPLVKIVNMDWVYEKDHPLPSGEVQETPDGGVVLFVLFPRVPGLEDAIHQRFAKFDYDVKMLPTKGV